MNFDLGNINQLSSEIDRHFFLPFYESIHKATANNHRFIAIMGPAIGTIDGTASLAQAVGVVGESAIKGLVNTLKGAVTFNWQSLKRGSLQLILGIGVISICSIPLIAFRTMRISVKMMIDPKQTSEQQARNYRMKLDLKYIGSRV